MIISDDTRKIIIDEFSKWVEIQYAGKSKEDRQKFGQFFTPPELTIKMLEKFTDLKGNILDPTAGCGGLLAASIIAGANPRKCYGIELDSIIANLCRERLSKLGVPRLNIKIGNALDDSSYDFNESYVDKFLIYIGIKDLGFSKVECNIELYFKNGKMKSKKWTIELLKSDSILKKQVNEIYKLLNLVNDDNEKNTFIFSEKILVKINFLKLLFKKYLNINFKYDNNKLIEI